MDKEPWQNIEDPVMEGALGILEGAKGKLRERAQAYDGFFVDDYMLVLNEDYLAGYLQMIHLKTKRAISCHINGHREGLLDSLVDLINYTAFAYSKAELLPEVKYAKA